MTRQKYTLEQLTAGMVDPAYLVEVLKAEIERQAQVEAAFYQPEVHDYGEADDGSLSVRPNQIAYDGVLDLQAIAAAIAVALAP